jgi:DNA-binding helix-hairpin-helix protein with protein kinase domain
MAEAGPQFAERVSTLDIDRGAQIGEGGTGRVYEIPSRPDLLFKEYRLGVLQRPDELVRLVQWRWALDGVNRVTLDATTAWPNAVVVGPDGAIVGVLIPRASARFVRVHQGVSQLREIQWMTFPERAARLGWTIPEPLVRLRLVAEFARLLVFFRRHGIIHGDISGKNLLWSVDSKPSVFMLDCDGAILEPGKSALPTVYTPGWTDTRVMRKERDDPDSDSDVFGLALIFMRLYFGRHIDVPGDARKLTVPEWPPPVPELLHLTGQSLGNRVPRPDPESWASALDDAARRLDDPTGALGRALRDRQPETPLRGDRSPPAVPISDPRSRPGRSVPPPVSSRPVPPPPPAPSDASLGRRILIAVGGGIAFGVLAALLILLLIR